MHWVPRASPSRRRPPVRTMHVGRSPVLDLPLGGVEHDDDRDAAVDSAKLLALRKQYFLAPTDDGFDAWDVDRLIAG